MLRPLDKVIRIGNFASEIFNTQGERKFYVAVQKNHMLVRSAGSNQRWINRFILGRGTRQARLPRSKAFGIKHL